MTIGELPGLAGLTYILGWTLVHFVWQGLLIGALFFVVNSLLAERSANTRYVWGIVCLATALLTPAATFAVLLDASRDSAAGVNTSLAMAGLAAPGASLLAAIREGINEILPFLVLLWGAGVLLLSTRTLVGWRMAHKLCRRGVRPLTEELQTSVDSMMQQFRLSSTVTVLESVLVHVPTVIGWLKPVILLPASVALQMEHRQLAMVIAHELGHIRRYDYLLNLFQVIVETVLFYHPVVRWMSGQIRQERENCCDDLVIRTCGQPVIYAKALANLEGLRQGLPEPAIAANGGDLLERVRRIVHGANRNPKNGRSSLVVTVLVGLAAVLAAQSNLLATSTNNDGTTPVYQFTNQSTDWQGFLKTRGSWQKGLAMMPDYLEQSTQIAASELEEPTMMHPVLTSSVIQSPANVNIPARPFDATTLELPPNPASGSQTMEHQVSADTGVLHPGQDAKSELLAEPAVMTTQVATEEHVFFGEQGQDVRIRATEKVAPRYPLKARKQGLEGFVKLEFELNKYGKVKQVSVVEAFPEEIFDKAAIRALRGWRFEVPDSLKGAPLTLIQTFDFNLDEEQMFAANSKADRRCRMTGSRLCGRTEPNVQVVYVNPPSNRKSM